MDFRSAAKVLLVFLGAATMGGSRTPASNDPCLPEDCLTQRSDSVPLGILTGREEETLFGSDQLLEFTLEADWEALDGDRGQESPERSGRLLWVNSAGEEFSIPLAIRTRGNFRLQRTTCPFPPLRLNFPSEGTDGTVFRGQDKVKLVTHCRDRDSYEQNVLEEYLAYRLYNLLTDISFRVRLARITYRDAAGEEDPVTRMGFLIEEDEALAARHGGTIIEVPAAPAAHFQQQQAGLMYLFQFMIGNTDWSLTQFHNMKILRKGRDYFPLPYDFDWSGLVDAPYAGPNPRIAHVIDDVRERLYMGYCDERIDYESLFAHVLENRPEILALPASIPNLSERNQEDAVRYLEGFFEIIQNERWARRRIVEACLG